MSVKILEALETPKALTVHWHLEVMSLEEILKLRQNVKIVDHF